jgi:hypothetical protein
MTIQEFPSFAEDRQPSAGSDGELSVPPIHGPESPELSRTLPTPTEGSQMMPFQVEHPNFRAVGVKNEKGSVIIQFGIQNTPKNEGILTIYLTNAKNLREGGILGKQNAEQ